MAESLKFCHISIGAHLAGLELKLVKAGALRLCNDMLDSCARFERPCCSAKLLVRAPS
jgi:hypothetical protein